MNNFSDIDFAGSDPESARREKEAREFILSLMERADAAACHRRLSDDVSTRVIEFTLQQLRYM